jgi:uncharacterized cupin superfamily protein
VGIAHLYEIEGHEFRVGHLQATWSFLGHAAGSVGVGVTRLQIPSGGSSTPAHDHGVEEELFYVLGGRALAWHKGETFEIGEGDCILFLPAAATTRCTRSTTSTSSSSARASTTRARASRGWALRSSASATSRASTVPPMAS